jgi:hypothetical protein
MQFIDSVLTVLSVVKKGAEIVNELSEKDESLGFAQPKRVDLSSNLTAAKAPLREMQKPVGMGLPNMETAYRYFSNNLSRDTNLRIVQGENYVARKRKATPATMTVAADAKVKGFTASYKTTGVPTA